MSRKSCSGRRVRCLPAGSEGGLGEWAGLVLSLALRVFSGGDEYGEGCFGIRVGSPESLPGSGSVAGLLQPAIDLRFAETQPQRTECFFCGFIFVLDAIDDDDAPAGFQILVKILIL